MAPHVSNFRIIKKSFDNVERDLVKGYPFAHFSKDESAKLRSLLPKAGYTLTFDLKDVNVCIANGYRRVMLDEIVHPHFNTQYGMIDTDDDFCGASRFYIRDKINMIPISYVPPPPLVHDDTEDTATEYKFELNVQSTVDSKMAINSNMIKPLNKASEKIRWSENIDITYLGPGKRIKIEIVLKWGINRENATHSHFGPVTFAAKGYASDKKLKRGELPTLPPSYQLITDNFSLGFSCEWFDDPYQSCMLGWQTMLEKLQKTIVYFDEFIDNDSTIPHQTNFMNVTQTKDKLIRYELVGESYTLSNILSWYGYKLDTSIAHIRSGDDHPEDNSTLVMINHPEHAELLRKAAKAAIVDIENIISQFKKLKPKS